MRINLGCQLQFNFPQETPMVAVLNVHYSHFGDLERPDFMVSSPSVPLESYRDGFGNWCTRLIAPSGDFELRTDGIFRDKGNPIQSRLTQCNLKFSNCLPIRLSIFWEADIAKLIFCLKKRGTSLRQQRPVGLAFRQYVTLFTAMSLSDMTTQERHEPRLKQ